MNQSDSEQPQAPQGDGMAPVRDTADYHRRLRAAGIDPEADLPEDMDACRYALARRICMFVNTWHGCPEDLCQRQRGCMAPDSRCANVEELPPEEEERQWREVQPKIYKALKAHLAARGLGND